MPRPKAQSREQLVTAAMHCFWTNGFGSTSMDDLVRQIGTSRHAIYSECGGKTKLFLACLQAYQDQVVDPAFAQVEAENADISAIEEYFTFQINRAEETGLPFPGCLVANTTAETGVLDPQVRVSVENHNKRLKNGFLNALMNSAPDQAALDELAELLAISTQGLWLFSKSLTDSAPLRQYAKTLISLVRQRILQ